MDIAFKILVPAEPFGFRYQGFLASGLQYPSLMKCQRAEVAAAKAAAAADKTELHLRNRRHASRRLVGRVVCPHIRITVDIVHLILIKRQGGRILYHVHMPAVRFYEPLSRKWVGIAILYIEASGIQQSVCLHLLVSRKHDAVIDARRIACLVNRSLDKRNVTDINTAL